MAIVNIRDTGRNSARTNDVRELATKVQKPSDTESITAANTITAAESGTRYVLHWSNRTYWYTYRSYSIQC